MYTDNDAIMNSIRAKFKHVEVCPYQGKRIFFENAGGALTLKSVIKKSNELASIPDNQGRSNEASASLMNIIEVAKRDIREFFSVSSGDVFV